MCFPSILNLHLRYIIFYVCDMNLVGNRGNREKCSVNVHNVLHSCVLSKKISVIFYTLIMSLILHNVFIVLGKIKNTQYIDTKMSFNWGSVRNCRDVFFVTFDDVGVVGMTVVVMYNNYTIKLVSTFFMFNFKMWIFFLILAK